MMDSGQAEPPTSTVCSDSNTTPASRAWLSSTCQMVGTPPACVTCSLRISAVSVGPSPIFGPGKTTLVPSMGQV